MILEHLKHKKPMVHVEILVFTFTIYKLMKLTHRGTLRLTLKKKPQI